MTEPQPEPSDWLPSSNWHQPLKQILAYGMEVILQVNDASLEFDTHNTFYTTAAHSARTSVPPDDLHYYTSHPDRISVAAVAIWSYLIRTFFFFSFCCLCLLVFTVRLRILVLFYLMMLMMLIMRMMFIDSLC